MSTEFAGGEERRALMADRALRRILAEVVDGLRHGYFEVRVTCEVIGQGRRRLIVHAGKNYQFVIPGDECAPTDRRNTPHDRDLAGACTTLGPDNNPFGGSPGNTGDSMKGENDAPVQ